MLKHNPHGDSIWRWGFGELLGHEGEALRNGISALMKGPQRAYSLSTIKSAMCGGPGQGLGEVAKGDHFIPYIHV